MQTLTCDWLLLNAPPDNNEVSSSFFFWLVFLVYGYTNPQSSQSNYLAKGQLYNLRNVLV